MKIKFLTLAAVAAVAVAQSALADVTVTVTGATAFRQAALDTIKARYLAAGTPLFKYAHDQGAGALNGATRAVFYGNFPGVSGNTTITCCFTGSVEGVRALVQASNVDPAPPTYLAASAATVAASSTGGETSGVTTGQAALSSSISDLAFSDVKKSSTPFSASPLLPANPGVGVIVWTPITNKGSVITNVTSQQFRALMANGFQPLSLFTGNSTDTKNIYAYGRNDLSGTRTTLLAETGYGFTTAVNHYVTVNSTSTVINAIQKVPAGGVNSPVPTGFTQAASNASTVWGNNIDGNGGYNSGSGLRAELAKTTGSVDVYDADGSTQLETGAAINIVSFLSLSDAKSSRDTGGNGSGGKIIGFNGVTLSDFAADTTGSSTLSANDKAKITSGLYTAWGYENLYRANSITSGDKLVVYSAITSNLNTFLSGLAGLKTSDMAAGRATDGGTVGY